MILTGEHISELVRQGVLDIEPFDERCLQPASYDLHLHQDIQVYSYSESISRQNPDRDNSNLFRKRVIPQSGYDLLPDECILGRTVEKFKFPNFLAGRLEGVSTNGRIFLIVHSTAGYFDPEFNGTATLEIKNESPKITVLTGGLRIAQMSFVITSRPVKKGYKGRYQGQIDPTPSRDPVTT